MAETLKPETAEQAGEAVAWAVAEETPLEILGHGSKRGYGRPLQTPQVLDLSALTGVSLYEAEELVMSAGAGTPIAEMEVLLAEQNQAFAFEPPDLAPLWGGTAGSGSIGGVIACNLSGPRRIKAGAARDHFLGIEGVSGRGELFKSGGRVVKNVTGYDICKLMAGSFGTLAAMTKVTVKVLPAAEKTRSVLLFGLDDATALKAMTLAMQSPYEVSGAAHLPAWAAAKSEVGYVQKADGAVTALRVEGPGPSVVSRCAGLHKLLAGLGETEELHSMNSANFWKEVRDAKPFLDTPDKAIWRLSTAPQQGPGLAARLAELPGARWFFDWAGGLVWLAVEAGTEASAGEIRAAVAEAGGHATLLRASDAVRGAVGVFQPLDEAKAALTKRIKDSFDPRGVINRGRMYEGV
ncbi:MAG: glycolate oxidase subunit GlcE [Rhodovibrionaceae bacterium]